MAQIKPLSKGTPFDNQSLKQDICMKKEDATTINPSSIQACQKAGLKVHNVSGEHPASGLVIRDAQGRRFTVSEDLEIVSAGVASADVSVDRRAITGGTRTRTVLAQHAVKSYSRQVQSRARRIRSKAKMKQSG